MNNLSFEGSGRISVNVDELVKSPRVQAQVKAVTKIFNELLGTDRGSEFFEKATMTDHTPTPRTDAAECEIVPSANPDYDGPYKWVESRIARDLERELAEANREVSAQNKVVIAQANRLAHYKRLEAILEDRSDVVDGDYGVPEPNEANRILSEWRGPV